MKIHTYPGNVRAFKALIAAKYAGVEIEVPAFNMGVDNKSEAFLAKAPLGKVPVLETEKGWISESNAIARYVARLGGNIYGSDAYTTSVIDQWVDYCSNEIDPSTAAWLYPILGYMPYIAKDTQKAKENLKKVLAFLDGQLAGRSFLTGARITLADIVAVASLMKLYEMVFDAAFRAPFVNTNRWFNTCINQPNFKSVIGEFKFCEKMAEIKKEEKVKEAPKPAAPKKEEKPAASAEEEEAPAPKKKNVLDELPASSLVLDEWKRTYSNNETSMSIPWFFEHFDKEGYCVYYCSYKFNHELEKLFMTCNLIGGFLQRLDSLRKYGFGSLCIFGNENANGGVDNQTVSGVWVFRGKEIPFEMKDCDDSLVYDWKQLDVSNPEDKKTISDYFSWEGFSDKHFLDRKSVV